jgi:CHAT domain-containing protein
MIRAGRRIWGAAFLLACIPGTARAADVASLCAQNAAPGAQAGDPALGVAVAQAETLLADEADRTASADRAIALLGDAAAKNGATAGPVLGPYCAAAGEAYRLGKNGSPYQARAFLGDALRIADGAREPDVSALAAYRLGLVGVDDAAGATRGLKRSAQAAPTATTPALDDGPCATLGAPGMADQGAAYFTVTALQCAIQRADASGEAEIGARARLRLARFWLDYGRRTPAKADKAKANAQKIALEAIDAADKVRAPTTRVILLGRLADAAIDAGGAADPRLAAAAEAMTSAAAGNPAGQAITEALRARLALAHNDSVHAIALLRHAVFLESQTPLPLRLADWYLLLATADPANSAAHITAAFRALNAVRPLLPGYDGITEESNFALRVRPVFEALVDSRLADAASGDDPARIAEVQGFVEEYRQAELQSLFGSECVPARPPIRPAELKSEEILLYPILLPDRVELLYATGGKPGSNEAPRYHRLPPNRAVNRADVVGMVARMVDSTSYGGDTDWRAPAEQLYRILIAPIADRLGPHSTLVVIPDGPLSALPFAALVDEHGHFLVERTRLSIAPSLAYSQPGTPRAGRDLAVVAAALEKEVTLPVGTYAKLTGTGEEARFAVEDGRHNVLIENFHRADLVRALSRGRIDVLHLATHANFNGRSDRSYIVADGEAIPIADLRELINQNQTRGDQLDLLILSACQTAVGDDQASMGLAGAAVQAGARSALASLWEVNDAGTSELMKAFYTRYRAGASKADALRDAQLSLIRRGGDFADPNIWAAFTLLGGWR